MSDGGSMRPDAANRIAVQVLAAYVEGELVPAGASGCQHLSQHNYTSENTTIVQCVACGKTL